ncbi:MAG: GNAT family N-acetyltransferase [Lachnospiraceae bacterium]|nr:GNAT family N-acetyltransferase [Lachnospiraceae bacterium]
MSIQIFTLQDSLQWDSVVKSFASYDVYWLSGYVRAFQIHGDGEPLLFYYEGKEGLRGINVVMKRDIADDMHFSEKLEHGTFFDFSTPYGYGGWLIENPDELPLEELISEYEQSCRENAIVSEFVRFHPMVQNHEGLQEFYSIRELGEVVHMDLSSPEVIWNNITSKNRNVIRKAIKNDVQIYNGRFPQIYEEFRKIYDLTMAKDDAEPYYYFEPEFYESLLNDLPYNAQVFFAVKDEKIIAASIILAANGRMNYHLSGSLREYSSLAPTNLLLYRAALWGNANGYKTLYLGGGVGSGEDSLFRFKRAFYRGELNRFHIGKKVYDAERYAELCEMAGVESHSDKLIESGFFPEYRNGI